ncbi:trafficking kinesin-binding protein 1 isoform 2-T2 [Menidia menidia]
MNVCNSTDLPELEIISLLEEQLPVYKLRADTIFGYDQDDWLHTPLVEPNAALDLTTEQIEETLKYFLLCADRVGQMTKTYNDIDAVTRLLEEKERDLELAARIGQSLLKKNKVLSDRNEYLEEQVEHIREEVSQLRHDLSMKDELLQFYTHAAEESEGESSSSTPVRPSEANVSAPAVFPLDSLQKKLQDLEDENKSLRSAANRLETETICYEEKEQQLVNDCVKELRDANLQVSSLAEELARKTEDASRQQEEITHLLSQIVDLQKKAKVYAVENEELTQHLGAAKDAQRQLTAELCELQDKYAECMEMLHEAQEELKNLRNKTLPLSTSRRFHSLGLFPMDSLAAEIEGTMRKELQMDDPDVEEQRLHPKRVFQTVKNLNLMRQQRSSAAPSPLNIPGSNQTSCFTSGRSSRVGTPRSNSIYGSETGIGIILDNRTGSILEDPDDGSQDSNKRPPGTPGTPGSRDLEAALRRLSLRRDNYLSEKRFFEEERERKLAYLAKEDEKEDGEGSGGPGTPTESLLSLCSHPSLGSAWSGYSFTPRSYLPDKLQIVKPLEGSATLHAWQQLAQPHMGALLDHRPGVVTKGFRSLLQEHEQEQEDGWQMDQPEEDELSCDSFVCLSEESAAPLGPPCSTSTPSVCRNREGDRNSQSEGLHEAPSGAKEAAQGKDGHLASLPSPLSRCSPSLSLPSPSEMNGHVDLKELQALQASTMDHMPVNFPGKCMSSTSSTYTFTTCRILHPSDQLTSVSPSPAMAACQSSSSVGTPAHVPSPVPFSAPPTPSYTPCCTPRRLSLSHSLAESSTNLRDSTKTTSTSLGLVRLLQEHGISSSVYNPRSWDRALGSSGASEVPQGAQGQRCTARPEEREVRQYAKRPDTLLLLQPSTPPSSPHSRSASPTEMCPMFQFSPPSDNPPYYDAFLASKPARTILREVLSDLEKEQGGPTDSESQTEMSNLRLVDKLKRFRTLSPISASLSSGTALLAPFGSAGLGSSALGGGLPGLNAGLRRNRSYPAMVGASMAMKDPGGPACALIPHPGQTSQTQHTHHTRDRTHPPLTAEERHTCPAGDFQDSTTQPTRAVRERRRQHTRSHIQ